MAKTPSPRSLKPRTIGVLIFGGAVLLPCFLVTGDAFSTFTVAAAAGARQVICFPGNREGMSDEQGLENCAVGLKRLLPLAEKLGITLVMLTRQIDISVGSQFSVCGVCAGLLAARGWPLPVVLLASIGIGALLGVGGPVRDPVFQYLRMGMPGTDKPSALGFSRSRRS